MDFEQITTAELMGVVAADAAVTERELALLDRLVGALDEVHRLQVALAEMGLMEYRDVDA